MSGDEKLFCECFFCKQKLRFERRMLQQKIDCPKCHQKTVLYNPQNFDDSFEELAPKPSLSTCKTCNSQIAESAKICVHCGQNWPTINILCGHCGANDFDLEVYEDNSSVWASPSLLGVISVAVWEAMRSKPKRCIRCFNCGKLS